MAMMIKKWSFLASSALMYGLALIFSQELWWCMFLFLVPLFLLGSQEDLSFKEGYFYGVLQWALAPCGVLYSLVIMGTGPLIIRIIPSVLIVLYEALFVGLWFWVTQKILIYFSLKNPAARLAVWIATTYLYFYWVAQYSLCLFNAWEGYFLMHPLLPLAEQPALLSLMPIVGKELLTLGLLLTNAACTIPFVSQKKYLWFVSLIGLAPWLLSYTQAPQKKDPPKWLSTVAHIPQAYNPGTMLTPMAKFIQKKMRELIKTYPETELIIFPESSLQRVNLHTAPEIVALWNKEHLTKPINIVVGAFQWEQDKYRNSAYWIYDGQIKKIFNKRHAMALTEGIKGWYDFPFLRSLYYSRLPVVTASTNSREPFTLFKDTLVVPYICSELFFNNVPDDHYRQSVILMLCNDNWSEATYIRRLMFLAARFKALEWQRPIIYVAYSYSGYCDPQGYITPIH